MGRLRRGVNAAMESDHQRGEEHDQEKHEHAATKQLLEQARADLETALAPLEQERKARADAEEQSHQDLAQALETAQSLLVQERAAMQTLRTSSSKSARRKSTSRVSSERSAQRVKQRRPTSKRRHVPSRSKGRPLTRRGLLSKTRTASWVSAPAFAYSCSGFAYSSEADFVCSAGTQPCNRITGCCGRARGGGGAPKCLQHVRRKTSSTPWRPQPSPPDGNSRTECCPAAQRLAVFEPSTCRCRLA